MEGYVKRHQFVTFYGFSISLKYRVLLESSWTVIVIIASVKEYERGGQGHTSATLLHHSAT
jgi:hypothetical protein